jgi:hypothetical protein
MKKCYLGYLLLIIINSNAFSDEVIHSNFKESTGPAEIIFDKEKGMYVRVDKTHWIGVKVTRNGDSCKTTMKILLSAEEVEIEGLTIIKRTERIEEFEISCLYYLPKELRDKLASIPAELNQPGIL